MTHLLIINAVRRQMRERPAEEGSRAICSARPTDTPAKMSNARLRAEGADEMEPISSGSSATFHE